MNCVICWDKQCLCLCKFHQMFVCPEHYTPQLNIDNTEDKKEQEQHQTSQLVQ